MEQMIFRPVDAVKGKNRLFRDPDSVILSGIDGRGRATTMRPCRWYDCGCRNAMEDTTLFRLPAK